STATWCSLSPTSAVKRAVRALVTQRLAPGELAPTRASRRGGVAAAVRPDGGPPARDRGQRRADERQVGVRRRRQHLRGEVARDEAGVDVPGAEGGMVERPAMECDVGGRSDDHVLAEGAQHATDRLVPIASPGNEL